MTPRLLSRRGHPFLVLLAYLYAGSGTLAADNAAQKVEVDTASGAHDYSVEVMRTDAEREKGLMYRRSMPPDHGMLFDFGSNQSLMFWMKNTYIPLDMVFIGSDGRVVSIARDAKPLDETVIPSKKPAAGVLELNAGTAEKIGLKVGDEIKNPIFHNAGTVH